MDPALVILILTTLGVFVMAVLFSHFGNGGTAGYLAVLILSGIPLILKPVALSLTMLVTLVVAAQALRSGRFLWRKFWPFAVGSLPAAYLAHDYVMRPFTYRVLVAVVLLLTAIRLIFSIGMMNEAKTKLPPIWIAIPAGAVIGVFVGLVGMGGGIFLSPLLLLMRWAKTEEAVGIAAPFVLVNALTFFLLGDPLAPLMVPNMLYWAPAAFVGAWVGTELSIQVFPAEHLGKAVAVVLGLAALKVVL